MNPTPKYYDYDHTATDDGWAIGWFVMMFVFFSFLIWACAAAVATPVGWTGRRRCEWCRLNDASSKTNGYWTCSMCASGRPPSAPQAQLVDAEELDTEVKRLSRWSKKDVLAAVERSSEFSS